MLWNNSVCIYDVTWIFPAGQSSLGRLWHHTNATVKWWAVDSSLVWTKRLGIAVRRQCAVVICHPIQSTVWWSSCWDQIYENVLSSVTCTGRQGPSLDGRTRSTPHFRCRLRTLGQPGSSLPCEFTPCFPGRRRRSSPSARRSLTSPREQRAGRGGDFSLCSDPASEPVWSLSDAPGGLWSGGVGARWHASSFRGDGLISAGFFFLSSSSPTAASIKLSKQSPVTCGSLLPS